MYSVHLHVHVYTVCISQVCVDVSSISVCVYMYVSYAIDCSIENVQYIRMLRSVAGVVLTFLMTSAQASLAHIREL